MPGVWYTLASYVLEIPVEKRHSPFSGVVVVSFHRGQYKLSSQNAVYSFGKYYTSFAIPFEALEISSAPVSSILILGFGLGSVVNLLEQNKNIEQITAVEGDSVILELAEKYLISPLKNKLKFQQADAAAFMQQNNEVYDLILFDVFVDDKTPQVFLGKDFLELLKKALSANGFLMFSKLDMTHVDHIENAHFEKTFRQVFPQAFSVNASGNKMYCARN